MGELQNDCMEMILHSGNARYFLMESVKVLKEANHDEYERLKMQAKTEISEAHKVQYQLLQQEARGIALPIDMLLIHAQDHLMTTMAIRDMLVMIEVLL